MIDPDRLPNRALLDTNVLIFALGGTKHPQSALARELFELMVERKRRMLLAAPSVAELEMGATKFQPPHGALIEVVAFDLDAAYFMAQRFPANELKQYRDSHAAGPGGRRYITYDAMIVACAGRHKASCIISTDDHVAKLAAKAGVRCNAPSDFQRAQLGFEDMEH